MPSYLDELIEGRIYVEANIFLFTALADVEYGPATLEFLERSSEDGIELLTSTLTIDEVSFVALKAELEEKYGVTKNQVLYLKRNPEVVKALASDVNQIVENVLGLTTLMFNKCGCTWRSLGSCLVMQFTWQLLIGWD
jgi:predicted nucleic acid-binding protein